MLVHAAGPSPAALITNSPTETKGSQPSGCVLFQAIDRCQDHSQSKGSRHKKHPLALAQNLFSWPLYRCKTVASPCELRGPRPGQCTQVWTTADHAVGVKLVHRLLRNAEGQCRCGASASVEAGQVPVLTQSLGVCRQTFQPNDPRQVPLVGERRSLQQLMEAYAQMPEFVRNLEVVMPSFPEYRAVIGDGNCFYRWCCLCRRCPLPCFHVLAGAARAVSLRSRCKQGLAGVGCLEL